jgi:hypothetical protein
MMQTVLAVAVAAMLSAAFLSGPADAAGCLKGAAVGHFAGHHGLLGAGVGCAIGHHEANKNARRAGDRESGSSTDNSDQGR